ncbi:ATP-binding protein [Leptolyngbya sp. ST-U4]|uniref:ATP-binding protein n=1 Tax=Leptolyngbya sp. ST-U4 TaxID=2933912 RepID=UPI003297C008
MIFLGRDFETEEPIYVESDRSRAILICGKRGSGKSYTMGVFLEELYGQEDSLVIVIDPLRNFYTMSRPNDDQEEALYRWNLSPRSVPVRLLIPGDPIKRYGEKVIDALKSQGVQVESFRINPGDLTPDTWLDLFDLSLTEPMGLALYRSVSQLRHSEGVNFSLEDLIEKVKKSSRSKETTTEALLARLEVALDEWDLFSSYYKEVTEIFDVRAVNVIDVGVLGSSRFGLRNLVVLILTQDLFRKRSQARLQEELGLPTGVPKVWLAIDEAQEFVPSGRASLSKESLIQWVKEGRQPGLSLVAATQQPAAIDRELLSQCDLVLAHKVTTSDDVDALNRLSHNYMASELKQYLRQIDRRGEALLVDDEEELVRVVQVRPRRSRHGGAELK